MASRTRSPRDRRAVVPTRRSGYGARMQSTRQPARLVLAFAVAVAVAACRTTAPVGSIGVLLERDLASGALYVRDVPGGARSDLFGLRPGDRVKMIDGVFADGLERERVRALLRGAVGTRVTLTVLRGGEVHELSIERNARHGRGDLPALDASTPPAAHDVTRD